MQTTVARREHPQLPLPTGAAAALIGTTEPKLADTVRRGLVQPPPPVLAGRRLWSSQHLLQAAAALGLLTAELQVSLDAEGEQ